MMAHLVYDSLRESLPVGARAPRRLSRHTLYEVDRRYSVDLLLEFKNDLHVDMTGQVLNRVEGSSSEVTVSLLSGDEVIASTTANDHGEFRMEFDSAGQLRLHIQAGDDLLEIPLSKAPEHRSSPSAGD